MVSHRKRSVSVTHSETHGSARCQDATHCAPAQAVWAHRKQEVLAHFPIIAIVHCEREYAARGEKQAQQEAQKRASERIASSHFVYALRARARKVRTKKKDELKMRPLCFTWTHMFGACPQKDR